MIKSFRLNNYKSLSDTNYIDLTRFTFLFGGNGAGKSSLIEALRLFATNIAKYPKYKMGEEPSIFTLVTDKNLGTFEDILNKNSKDDKISYEFILNYGSSDALKHNFYHIPSSLRVKLVFSSCINGMETLEKKKYSNEMELCGWEIEDLDSGFQIKRHGNDMDLKLGIFDPNSEIRYFGNYPKGLKIDKIQKYYSRMKVLNQNNSELFANLIKLIFNNFRDASILSVLDLRGTRMDQDMIDGSSYVDELLIEFREMDLENIEENIFENDEPINIILYLFGLFDDMIGPYCEYAQAALINSFDRLRHLGHFRAEVPSIFSPSDKRNNIIEDKFFSWLVESLDYFDDAVPPDEIPDKDQDPFKALLIDATYPKLKLMEILKQLELGDEINYVRIGEAYKLFLIQNGKKINLANTSSGFKQIFPIIMEIVYSWKITLLFIEQPELHLHPKLQTKLIEVMVQKSEGKNIIETHSEHIIRKMQVLVAEKKISNKDINIFYFMNEGNGTEIHKLRLDNNGLFIDKWPNGFFDEAAELTYQLMEVIANRKN